MSNARRDASLVGNIYKGKVVKILPGMQSAFVDIGLEKAAFLYVGDIQTEKDEFAPLFEDEENDDSMDFLQRRRPFRDVYRRESCRMARNCSSRFPKTP